MTERIPFVDLKQQYQMLKTEIDGAVHDVMHQADFILGQAVQTFEHSFADYVGAAHGIGVSSGTDALLLALKALDIGPGDEVITAANTFIATVLAISHSGAQPVLADVRCDDFGLDPEKVREAITPRTKAIVPVHLCGLPVSMSEILKLGKQYSISIVEDACQAHGARYHQQTVGALGALGCFSFYPGKNLGAYGDGGMIVTNNPGLAERVLLLRNYGQKPKNVHLMKGFNSRLDAIQAAILSVKLPHLDAWNRARRQAAAWYRTGLVGLPLAFQGEFPEREHIYHLFVIQTARRDELAGYLAAEKIDCGIHYPTPIHLQPAYQELEKGQGSYPVTEKLARESLTLPMFPEITREQVNRVCDAIRTFFNRG